MGRVYYRLRAMACSTQAVHGALCLRVGDRARRGYAMRTVEVDAGVRLYVAQKTGQAACDVLAYMALTCDKASLQSVAAHAGCHPNTVANLVRDACDLTFGEALLEMRMQRGYALARAGAGAVQAARCCGYEKPRRFCEAFRCRWGVAFEDVSCECMPVEPSRRVAGLTRELALPCTLRVAVADPDDALAYDMLAYVGQHCGEASLAGVAERFGLHPNTASALVRRATGKTFSQVLRASRMARARELLASCDMSVEQVSRACGYENTASFYRAFRNAYGHAPRECSR